MKRGYATDITTLSVFHHLLSFLLIYLLSSAKIRILSGLSIRKVGKNGRKKTQSFAYLANNCVFLYLIFFIFPAKPLD